MDDEIRGCLNVYMNVASVGDEKRARAVKLLTAPCTHDEARGIFQRFKDANEGIAYTADIHAEWVARPIFIN